MRRDEANNWPSANDADLFVAGTNREPTDAVYRCALKAEAAKSEGQGAAIAIDDFVHFFEIISHANLVTRCLAEGYSMRILRACIFQYRALRFLVAGGIALPGLAPEQGVVAGCCFADVKVKIFVKAGLARIADANPRVEIYIFYDDISVSAVGPQVLYLMRLRLHANKFQHGPPLFWASSFPVIKH